MSSGHPAYRQRDEQRRHDGRVDRGGAECSRLYYEQLVGPAVDARWPGLPRAAGRLGSGSDVLGLDDAVSQDHDWGLRLNLLVSADIAAHVDAYLEETLPESFEGLPIRFTTTWDAHRRHRVQVQDVASFVHSRTGVDLRDPLSTDDWLMLTGQAVLEVTAGPVFVDTDGALTAARAALCWYPDEVWKYVIAADWARLAQELPFVGRTAEVGDDLGSRVITARLVEVATHLAHLIDRRWPPYSKWLGTSLTPASAIPRGCRTVGPSPDEHALAHAGGRPGRGGANPQPSPGRRRAAHRRRSRRTVLGPGLSRHPRRGPGDPGEVHRRPSRSRPSPRGRLRGPVEPQRRRPDQPVPPTASTTASVRWSLEGVAAMDDGPTVGARRRVLAGRAPADGGVGVQTLTRRNESRSITL